MPDHQPRCNPRTISRHRPRHRRHGKVIILLAILLPVFVAMLAFAVDLGTVLLVRTELQRSADAATLAATAELEPSAKPAFPLKSPTELHVGVPEVLAVSLQRDFQASVTISDAEIDVISPDTEQETDRAYEVAEEYAEQNDVTGVGGFQQRQEDIDVFHLESGVAAPSLLPLPPALQGFGASVEALLLAPPDTNLNNAVRVTTRCDQTANDPVSLFFAPVIGTGQSSVRTPATAAYLKGYGVRPGAKMLPIAMDITVWRALRLGNGAVNGVPLAQELLGAGGRPVILMDEQSWDRETHAVSGGSDLIWEVLLLNQPIHEVELPGIDEHLLMTLLSELGVLEELLGAPLEQLIAWLEALGEQWNGLEEKTPATIVTLNLSGGSEAPASSDVSRQILDGVNAADVGDKLYLPFERHGEESVSSDRFSDFEQIIGKPRIIPLFETDVGTMINKGTGQNSEGKYRLIGFGGIVVTEVRDMGAAKYIKFQPAPIMSKYVLRSKPDHAASYSDCVYTCPLMVD